MGQVAMIGLDLAKSVFQVHGVDAAGEVVMSASDQAGAALQVFVLQPACLVGMESLRVVASLGAGAERARARSEADAGAVREALCETRQERRG